VKHRVGDVVLRMAIVCSTLRCDGHEYGIVTRINPPEAKDEFFVLAGVQLDCSRGNQLGFKLAADDGRDRFFAQICHHRTDVSFFAGRDPGLWDFNRRHSRVKPGLFLRRPRPVEFVIRNEVRFVARRTKIKILTWRPEFEILPWWPGSLE
jgi:hypothetical protein